MSHHQGDKEVSRSKIEPNHSVVLGSPGIPGCMDQDEFIEVKGVALNQTHSPERQERWRTADLLRTGAGETQQSDMVSNAESSRGLRLHRAKRTEDGATRRVTGKNVLYKNIYAKDEGVEYGEPT